MFNSQNKKQKSPSELKAMDEDNMKNTKQDTGISPSKPEGTTNTSQSQEKLPLFMKSPYIVDFNRHAKAGIRQNSTMEFAKDTNSLPLSVMEFIEAARFYPIVLMNEAPYMPMAIVGLEQKNIFVSESGSWQEGCYIPAYVRKYPFLFLEDAKNEKFTLCIDEGAANFAMEVDEKSGVRLYDEKGEATEFVRNALSFCLAIQQDFSKTREFCETLNALGILTPSKVDATLTNGQAISLSGFQQIDQEKFSQLSDAKILDLHKKGWLPLIHFMFLSASNWRSLLDMASKQKK